ncbi:pituitary tumor-transforming gene 1 protein-interacting protein-like isoform X2 [Xenia sp. Carnegie-2017]|uniref:pituitary tumor-transforming gene 1 protein-interacting protein-like isoform X2 n=1 Tax=Xenia sp. Carnegie-2017 TaxID=2897299 RepID=UPI001F04699C|nr:pituitary tumor-transforming gene 1 protein-interacting protein-like isoform X2 [Xenia sp. Carnegie-2017]
MVFKITIIGIIFFFSLLANYAHAGEANCTTAKKCDDCLKYNETTCFWCSSSSTCIKKDGVLPKGCGVNWRYYGNCNVPGYVWVIVLPVLGVVVLISIGCCFYCYCCRCRLSKGSSMNEETRFQRKRMELKQKHEERKAQRKIKNDEIRNKYGLNKSDGSGSSGRYHQFENDPSV